MECIGIKINEERMSFSGVNNIFVFSLTDPFVCAKENLYTKYLQSRP